MSNEDNAKSQAKAQYEFICNMVAALECDYDRLEELREQRDDFTGEYPEGSEIAATEAWNATTKGEELAELEEAAGECKDQDEARDSILENALSVEVRIDWMPCNNRDNKPTHFNIQLCTGGPACRIMGELDEYGEPRRAWLEYQDWGTPWSQYIGADQDVLLSYARCFYFGE